MLATTRIENKAHSVGGSSWCVASTATAATNNPANKRNPIADPRMETVSSARCISSRETKLLSPSAITGISTDTAANKKFRVPNSSGCKWRASRKLTPNEIIKKITFSVSNHRLLLEGVLCFNKQCLFVLFSVHQSTGAV